MNKRTLITVMSLIVAGVAPAAEKATSISEEKQKQDVRMKWWSEARFGMFVHWGLYSIPAGQWGKR